MRRLLLSALMLLASAATVSEPELKGSPQELRGFLHPNDKIVTISDTAMEKAYSDKAIISLVVTSEAEQLSDALAKNTALRASIKKDLVRAGIDASEIKSSKFSSSPQYGWFGKKPSSYKVINRVAISIHEEAHLKEVALVADRSGQIELSNTSFEHTKKDEYNQLVKQKALDKILKQKTFYESALGVKLVTIGIRDHQIHQQATRGAMAFEEIVVTAQRESRTSSLSKESYAPAAPPSFDEVKYQANLSVDFKIVDER